MDPRERIVLLRKRQQAYGADVYRYNRKQEAIYQAQVKALRESEERRQATQGPDSVTFRDLTPEQQARISKERAYSQERTSYRGLYSQVGGDILETKFRIENIRGLPSDTMFTVGEGEYVTRDVAIGRLETQQRSLEQQFDRISSFESQGYSIGVGKTGEIEFSKEGGVGNRYALMNKVEADVKALPPGASQVAEIGSGIFRTAISTVKTVTDYLGLSGYVDRAFGVGMALGVSNPFDRKGTTKNIVENVSISMTQGPQSYAAYESKSPLTFGAGLVTEFTLAAVGGKAARTVYEGGMKVLTKKALTTTGKGTLSQLVKQGPRIFKGGQMVAGAGLVGIGVGDLMVTAQKDPDLAIRKGAFFGVGVLGGVAGWESGGLQKGYKSGAKAGKQEMEFEILESKGGKGQYSEGTRNIEFVGKNAPKRTLTTITETTRGGPKGKLSIVETSRVKPKGKLSIMETSKGELTVVGTAQTKTIKSTLMVSSPKKTGVIQILPGLTRKKIPFQPLKGGGGFKPGGNIPSQEIGMPSSGKGGAQEIRIGKVKVGGVKELIEKPSAQEKLSLWPNKQQSVKQVYGLENRPVEGWKKYIKSVTKQSRKQTDVIDVGRTKTPVLDKKLPGMKTKTEVYDIGFKGDAVKSPPQMDPYVTPKAGAGRSSEEITGILERSKVSVLGAGDDLATSSPSWSLQRFVKKTSGVSAISPGKTGKSRLKIEKVIDKVTDTTSKSTKVTSGERLKLELFEKQSKVNEGFEPEFQYVTTKRPLTKGEVKILTESPEPYTTLSYPSGKRVSALISGVASGLLPVASVLTSVPPGVSSNREVALSPEIRDLGELGGLSVTKPSVGYISSDIKVETVEELKKQLMGRSDTSRFGEFTTSSSKESLESLVNLQALGEIQGNMRQFQEPSLEWETERLAYQMSGGRLKVISGQDYRYDLKSGSRYRQSTDVLYDLDTLQGVTSLSDTMVLPPIRQYIGLYGTGGGSLDMEYLVPEVPGFSLPFEMDLQGGEMGRVEGITPFGRSRRHPLKDINVVAWEMLTGGTKNKKRRKR